jgi:tRNA-splicing endonuclease subunit Sen34
MSLSKENIKLCVEESFLKIKNLESFHFPETKEEILKFKIFKDLWKKGYYVTLGNKFGGDYLLYSGDPMNYHAQYIVLCLEFEKFFQTNQIATLGRLANSVKKDVLLSTYIEKEDKIEYITLKWHK